MTKWPLCLSPSDWLATWLLPALARNAGWRMQDGGVIIPADHVMSDAALDLEWRPESFSGTSALGGERSDEPFGEGNCITPHALHPLRVGLSKQVGAGEVGDDIIADLLNVDPHPCLVWNRNGLEQEKADHVSQRDLLTKFLVQSLPQRCLGLIGHVRRSVRVLRAGLKGDDRVAGGHPHQTTDCRSDSDTDRGGRA